MSLARKGKGTGKNNVNYGKPKPEERRKRISYALKGEKHPMYGKKMTKEEIRKRAEARKSPARKSTHKLYLTLPHDLDVTEKRARLRELTGYSVQKIWQWVKAWEQGKT